MDNSWDYNDGQSEIRMGKALKDGYRQRVLLTKIDGRDKQTANKQLDESLKRLQVDHIDLVQHHEILRFEDPDRIFAPGGAQEALVDAKKAGKIRYIGFTGHKDPHVHLYMLQVAKAHGFTFDTVQMPINVMDAHFRSFSKLVVPEAEKLGMAIIGMKSMGSGVILKSNTATPVECLHYAMGLPTSVVVTGIDSMHSRSGAGGRADIQALGARSKWRRCCPKRLRPQLMASTNFSNRASISIAPRSTRSGSAPNRIRSSNSRLLKTERCTGLVPKLTSGQSL